MTRLNALLGAFLLLLFSAATSFAGSELNVTSTGLALRGVDPVSFFSPAGPVPGDFRVTAVHGGAVYRFASEENKAAFTADPDKYLPQYGGYCAMGVKMGQKLDGDPAVFTIVNDKLYLNVAPAVADMWRSEMAANIEAADEIWTKIESTDPGAL
ncbi:MULTISPECIES: YHS domain-containing (seleno)protein [unclassified Stappia]|uniref:YHS domain-containing (seleno)protein n=1 Tax=unclassified Stappia TaxID=2629676 RepID=UPI00164374DD|nr:MULTISPECIES: YHS domain-containing (seleno)protein [unclassified Stappia]